MISLDRRDGALLALGAIFLSTAGAVSADNSPSPAVDSSALPNPIIEYINQKPVEILSIHAGSFSIDNNSLSKEDIEGAVNSMIDAAPNLSHISIGTFLDYPDQIKMWADAAHARGKKIYVRSAGFNTWQNTFGEEKNGNPKEHINRLTGWINKNHAIFQDGDIMEAVPDEPANGKYWFRGKDRKNGVGSSEATLKEFNKFIIDATRTARETFDANGQTGVIVEVVHDNPAVVKDAIFENTASQLKIIGIDAYPETSETDTPKEERQVWEQFYGDWVEGVHPESNWAFTIGPNINIELGDRKQKAMFSEAAQVIFDSAAAEEPEKKVIELNEWLLGERDNWPTARGFNYKEGVWKPREVIEVFSQIQVAEPTTSPSPSPVS